jgi:hypothetical protein
VPTPSPTNKVVTVVAVSQVCRTSIIVSHP